MFKRLYSVGSAIVLLLVVGRLQLLQYQALCTRSRHQTSLASTLSVRTAERFNGNRSAQQCYATAEVIQASAVKWQLSLNQSMRVANACWYMVKILLW
jgi:hypothetical protein